MPVPLLDKNDQASPKPRPTATPTPTKIEPFSQQSLRLDWQSGESFELSYLDLRYYCPCASCIDEYSGKRTLKRENIIPGIKAIDVQPIGHYAVQIYWSDKHQTGIYNYDTLWLLSQKMGLRLK